MCGIVGLIGTQNAAREAFLALTTLQHRGQDAAGILTYDDDGFHRVKNIGLVENVFDRQNIETLTGSVAIGHARYSTIGRGDLVDVQPFLLSYPYGIGMVHNGNIVNVQSLKAELQDTFHRRLLTRSDTEMVLNLFAEYLVRRDEPAKNTQSQPSSVKFDALCEAVQKLFDRVNGSYSIVTLVAEHGLIAFRDPFGIRPLVWGQRQGGELKSGVSHAFASESVALDFLGYESVRDLQPGEVVFVDFEGGVHSRVLKPVAADARRSCMFEWIYFASPESILDEVPVYGTRIQLGKSLAALVREKINLGELKPEVIVPVPETSRIAAIALSEELGIPYRETLIKNRYIKRTFILDSQEKRQSAVRLKLSPVRSEIQGKRVLLVDDSIVRGTTSRKIIELVRAAGAKEVYFVSTCPPIQHPCYYGIDFPDRTELVAHGRTAEEIRVALGADAIVYQDLDGLRASIVNANPKLNPCMACLTGCYPTEIESGARFAEQRKTERSKIDG